MPNGSKRKQTYEQGLNGSGEIGMVLVAVGGANTLQSVPLLKSGKFPAFFVIIGVQIEPGKGQAKRSQTGGVSRRRHNETY